MGSPSVPEGSPPPQPDLRLSTAVPTFSPPILQKSVPKSDSQSESENEAKMVPKWNPRGPPNRTKIDPRRPGMPPRRVSDGVSGSMSKKHRFSDPHWTVKMRLPPKRELNFHFSKGLPNVFPKLTRNGAEMAAKSARRRPEVAPRAFPKNIKNRSQN